MVLFPDIGKIGMVTVAISDRIRVNTSVPRNEEGGLRTKARSIRCQTRLRTGALTVF